MGPLGWQETVVIFVLALLLFGPKKLPELGKTIGKALTEFRRASSELKSTFDREMANLEQETAEVRQQANNIGSDIKSSLSESDTSYNYDYNYYDNGYDGYQSSESTDSSPSTDSASATQGAESSDTSDSVQTASAVTEPDALPGVQGSVPVSTPVERKEDAPQAEPSRQNA